MLKMFKSLGEGFMDFMGSGVILTRMEKSFEKMRGEMRETLSEYLMKSQRALVDGIVIAIILGIGFFYLTNGLAEVIEFYSAIPGIGSIVMGGVLLLVGLLFLRSSQKKLRA